MLNITVTISVRFQSNTVQLSVQASGAAANCIEIYIWGNLLAELITWSYLSTSAKYMAATLLVQFLPLA